MKIVDVLIGSVYTPRIHFDWYVLTMQNQILHWSNIVIKWLKKAKGVVNDIKLSNSGGNLKGFNQSITFLHAL